MRIYRRKNIWKFFLKSIYKLVFLCYINNNMNNHGGNIMKKLTAKLPEYANGVYPDPVRTERVIVFEVEAKEQVKGLER